MSLPEIVVQKIRYPLKSRLFFSEKGLLWKWHVNPGDTFLKGSALCELTVQIPHFESLLGRRMILYSSEPGVLISRMPGLANRESNYRFSNNDVLCAYIPLEQWRAFSALLERHEQSARRYRDTGRHIEEKKNPKTLRVECRDYQKKTERLTKENLLLNGKLSAIERETEDKRRRGAELKADLDTAMAGLKKALSGYPVERLLERILERFDALRSPSVDPSSPSVRGTVHRLMAASESLLGSRIPLPQEELVLVSPQLNKFLEISRFFGSFDQQMSAILRDAALDEKTRAVRIKDQGVSLRMFSNTAFKNHDPSTTEAT